MKGLEINDLVLYTDKKGEHYAGLVSQLWANSNTIDILYCKSTGKYTSWVKREYHIKERQNKKETNVYDIVKQ